MMKFKIFDRIATPFALRAAIAGCLSAVVLTTATIASAFTYSYQGNNYGIIVDNVAPGAYLNSMNVSGSFTVDTALAGNITFGDAGSDISGDVTGFSFFDGRTTLTEASGLFLAQFEVGTDALGNITAWDIVLQLFSETTAGSIGLNDTQLVIATRSGSGQPASDVGRRSLCTRVDPFGFCSVSSDLGLASNNPGTWSRVDRDASPIPEPATLLLLGSGLTGLAWMRRRRRAA